MGKAGRPGGGRRRPAGVEGNSERAVARVTDVNPRTIAKISLDLGQGAVNLHNRIARELQGRRTKDEGRPA
jgi:hypothetical protein